MHAEHDSITDSLDAKTGRVDATGVVKFGGNSSFLSELRARVDQYFKSTGKRPRDCPKMYVKSAIIAAWFLVSYILLVFVAPPWWLALPLAVSFAFAAAAVTFNIQHDGGHKAYSNYGWVNRLAALTMDLVGASSYLWRWKHGVYHHTCVNVAGQDTDIDIGAVARLAPQQRRRWLHRFQHLYMWVLYGLMTVRWHLLGDFQEIIAGRIGPHRIPRPRGWDLVLFLVGKTFSLTLVLAIPLLFHPFWVVAVFYLLVTGIMGVVMAVVFQMAHCVEEAEYPLPDKNTNRIATSWAQHQVETTVNFSRRSRILSWLLGGLNFQIEHHLFPRICHIHYPALSAIVQEVCRKFGVKYAVHENLLAGIRSHFRWLRRLGMTDAM